MERLRPRNLKLSVTDRTDYLTFFPVIGLDLDWDSNHQLLAYEDFVISTRPSRHLTYCKTFTNINLKVALHIRGECAYRIRSEFEFSSFLEFQKYSK